LQHIRAAGRGVVLYLKQETRGIGLARQLRDYREPSVQRASEARENSDPMKTLRDYGTGAQILHELGVRKLKLLSNRPPKLSALEGFDLEIVGHVPLTEK
jgi:3,4-dihydroxy 2-butanone 4-phosphate synthase / GTP cyclohydrolase II